MEKYLECGKIINTHGYKGTVKIESWCDSVDVLCSLETMYYKKRDDYLPLTVTSASVHKGCALVTFAEIDTMEAAQLMKNRIVYAERDDLAIGDDRVFVADMIGLPVYDEHTGVCYGKLADLMETPTSDLFVVATPDGKEVLVPAVDEFIGHVDDNGVYLCPIAGMFDDDGETIDDSDTAGK